MSIGSGCVDLAATVGQEFSILFWCRLIESNRTLNCLGAREKF